MFTVKLDVSAIELKLKTKESKNGKLQSGLFFTDFPRLCNVNRRRGDCEEHSKGELLLTSFGQQGVGRVVLVGSGMGFGPLCGVIRPCTQKR